MSETFRVGVAGLTHGHVFGLINSFKNAEGVSLVAVADKTDLLAGQKENFERSYTDWAEMLDKEHLDGLLVTSDNVESSQIAIAALNRGIPCIVEKAMAANAADADLMLAAQKASGKTLMINWPLAWNAWIYALKSEIEADKIGHVFHLRFRNGHHGPKEIGCNKEFVAWLHDEKLNGGGAIADFCSYGAALARWLFGMPERVTCVRGNYTKDYDISDDHAVLLLEYSDKNVFIEGTWATFGFDSGPNPVVHGKTGTIANYNGTLRVHRAGKDAEDLEVAPLEVTNPATYFVECVRSGRTPEGILNPEIAADACRILDAGIKSARTKCAVKP